MAVTMVAVESSNIEAIGRDGQQLYVRFKKGGVYSYGGVPDSVYDGLMAAPSKGQFFQHRIAYNKSYPFEKLSDEEATRRLAS